MKWGNDAGGYGWLTIILHWLAAAGLIAMLVIGLMADAAGDAGDRARRFSLLGIHISLGVTLAALLLARVIAYYGQRQPEPAPQPAPLSFAASATHHLLLLAIVALMVSGPVTVWSAGYPVGAWGLFSIPSPFWEGDESVHEVAETVHLVGRYMLYVLIPLHVLGAFKHLLLDRDGVFQRIITPTSAK